MFRRENQGFDECPAAENAANGGATRRGGARKSPLGAELVSRMSDDRNEREQYSEKIQLLIGYGADVNRKIGHLSIPDKIETPFLFAVDNGNCAVIDLL